MSESYSRLYHRFPKEFSAIYRDDHALSAWIRLLIVADASWPLRPPVPRSVSQKTLQLLVDAGLVLIVDDSYSVRGLDAERTRRSDAGRNAAAMRWAMRPHEKGNADSNAKSMPRRDEQSKDELDTPPPPTRWGQRDNGTNPRETGVSPRQTSTNPRANGTSTRQVRQSQKRGPTALGDVLRRASQ